MGTALLAPRHLRALLALNLARSAAGPLAGIAEGVASGATLPILPARRYADSPEIVAYRRTRTAKRRAKSATQRRQRR